MKQYIGCDLHRDYPVFAGKGENGRVDGPWPWSTSGIARDCGSFCADFPAELRSRSRRRGAGTG